MEVAAAHIGSSPVAEDALLRLCGRDRRRTGGKTYDACLIAVMMNIDYNIYVWFLHANCICSGRLGSVQQQYRPRSLAGAPTQGNATSYAPAGSAAAAVEHMEPVDQGANACGMCDYVIISHVHLCIQVIDVHRRM